MTTLIQTVQTASNTSNAAAASAPTGKAYDLAANAGQTTRIKAGNCQQFQLIDSTTQLAPKNLRSKRLGDDLEIYNAGNLSAQPDLIIEAYYSQTANLLGEQAAGDLRAFVHTNDTASKDLNQLLNNTNSPIGLSADSASGICAPILPNNAAQAINTIPSFNTAGSLGIGALLGSIAILASDNSPGKPTPPAPLSNQPPIVTFSSALAPKEGDASQGQTLLSASATHKDGSLPTTSRPIVFALAPNSDPQSYFAIDSATGTVTLTAAGAAHINGGGSLPALQVTANDGTGQSTASVAMPATTTVNDAPVLYLSSPTAPLEGSAIAGQAVLTASATDEEGSAITYSLVAGSNAAGYYAINPVTGAVTLTAAGAAHINAGGSLPAVQVSATDGAAVTVLTAVIPATTPVNDAPVLSLTTPATPLENSAAAGQLITTANATDEEGSAITYSLVAGSNAAGYYAIDAAIGAVTLTDAGAAFVNGGGSLPAVQVSATDGAAVTVLTATVPATSQVNDAPVLSLTTPTAPLENSAVAGQLITTASATDEEGSTVTYSLVAGSNAEGYYAINPATGAVTLTAAGAAWVNAGGSLPAVQVSATDGAAVTVLTATVPATTTVNDAPVLTLTTPVAPASSSAAAGNLIATASATDEENAPSLTA
jgi:flagellar basal body rod protein FlgG